MSSFLTYITLAALIGTGAILIGGLITMVRDRHSQEKSNKLMRYRVLFQGATLVLFASLFYFGR